MMPASLRRQREREASPDAAGRSQRLPPFANGAKDGPPEKSNATPKDSGSAGWYARHSLTEQKWRRTLSGAGRAGRKATRSIRGRHRTEIATRPRPPARRKYPPAT